MSENTKGIEAENSDVRIIRSQIKGMDKGVSAKSSKVDVIDSKIENKKNNSGNKRNWWIIIAAISGIVLVAFAVYEAFVVESISEKPVEIDDVSSETGGSTGIRIEGSTNVTSINNTFVGLDTGIEIINSRNVSSIDDTFIGP